MKRYKHEDMMRVKHEDMETDMKTHRQGRQRITWGRSGESLADSTAAGAAGRAQRRSENPTEETRTEIGDSSPWRTGKLPQADGIAPHSGRVSSPGDELQYENYRPEAEMLYTIRSEITHRYKNHHPTCCNSGVID